MENGRRAAVAARRAAGWSVTELRASGARCFFGAAVFFGFFGAVSYGALCAFGPPSPGSILTDT
jgi:hypothetical protein